MPRGSLLKRRSSAAFPLFVSATPSDTNAPGTAHSIANPTTVDADDILIHLAMWNANTTVTGPGAFTALSQNAGSPGQCEVWAKVATGSENGTSESYTTSTSQAMAALCLRISGASAGLVAGTDYDIAVAGPTFNTDPNPPSETATWGSGNNLWISMVGYRGDNAAVTGYPTSFVNGTYNVSTNGGGGGAGVAIATRELETATLDPDTFELDDAETWFAINLVLKAA